MLAGTGLQGSPNPITGAGSLNLAASYQLPQACTNGQVPKSNGSGGWACAADSTGGSGTVTSVTAGTGLTGGTITGSGTVAADTTYLQRRVSSSCAVGSSIRAIAADGTVTCQTDSGGAANAFIQGGNAYGPLPNATAVLGTTDANALDVRVTGARVMRYEPNAISPNLIGGSPANSVSAGVRGATIAGGGVFAGATDPNFGSEFPNRVTDAYGTIGGGYANQAGDDAGTAVDHAFATVGGGFNNGASALYSTVAGGDTNSAAGIKSAVGGGSFNNANGLYSTVAGGDGNVAWQNSSVGGGSQNTAKGFWSTVGGGQNNFAGDATSAFGKWSTVGGGADNTASGDSSTVGGGASHQALGSYSTVGGGQP